jgi:hypothetical protein
VREHHARHAGRRVVDELVMVRMRLAMDLAVGVGVMVIVRLVVQMAVVVAGAWCAGAPGGRAALLGDEPVAALVAAVREVGEGQPVSGQGVDVSQCSSWPRISSPAKATIWAPARRACSASVDQRAVGPAEPPAAGSLKPACAQQRPRRDRPRPARPAWTVAASTTGEPAAAARRCGPRATNSSAIRRSRSGSALPVSQRPTGGGTSRGSGSTTGASDPARAGAPSSGSVTGRALGTQLREQVVERQRRAHRDGERVVMVDLS